LIGLGTKKTNQAKDPRPHEAAAELPWEVCPAVGVVLRARRSVDVRSCTERKAGWSRLRRKPTRRKTWRHVREAQPPRNGLRVVVGRGSRELRSREHRLDGPGPTRPGRTLPQRHHGQAFLRMQKLVFSSRSGVGDAGGIWARWLPPGIVDGVGVIDLTRPGTRSWALTLPTLPTPRIVTITVGWPATQRRDGSGLTVHNGSRGALTWQQSRVHAVNRRSRGALRECRWVFISFRRGGWLLTLLLAATRRDVKGRSTCPRKVLDSMMAAGRTAAGGKARPLGCRTAHAACVGTADDARLGRDCEWAPGFRRRRVVELVAEGRSDRSTSRSVTRHDGKVCTRC